MKKPPKVEFYKSFRVMQDDEYGWRLLAPNGRIIATPHETFPSLSNAVRSFKNLCIALGMPPGVAVQVDGDGGIKERAYRLLCR